MHPHPDVANGDSRLSFWLRVRRFAVPPSMIETATLRRAAGDWAGACAAAAVDVDLDLRSAARTHGRDLASRLRADLRHLAPDLLRWHLPRVSPDGLLRPGLTVSLARYGPAPGPADGGDGPDPLHLVVRTPPAWADAGQRISLALWDPSRPGAGAGLHPHPRPGRRFRLDLHRHLWDARRAPDLAGRCGAADPDPPGPAASMAPGIAGTDVADALERLVGGRRCAVGQWADEAALVLRAAGRTSGRVGVRYGARQRLVLDVACGPGPRITAVFPVTGHRALPLLPDAATWVLPDADLLRAGLLAPDDLHPLVADALGNRTAGAAASPRGQAQGPHVVECRGALHRIGLVDGVLAALDHGPDEVRREELLAALTGTPLPCLQAIETAHRRPECLEDVRARLDHGDTAGALAVVEALLGPRAHLRPGALRDELEAAALRRIDHGLYRAGLRHPAYQRPPRHSAPRRAH
jgi:hypothetical protein